MREPSDYYRQLSYPQHARANPFLGARIKLKRAKRHLLEVANTAGDLPKRQPYHFVFGADGQTRKAQIIALTENFMPLEFAAVVGDTVHNLRAAFDHIAVALTAPPIGSGKSTNAYFPTGKDREEFIRARDGYTTAKGKWIDGKMEGAAADALRMVEELEPYGGGKHSLRPLHDLDILDKHKLIVPAITRMTIQRLDVIIGDETVSVGVTDFEANYDGTNLVAILDDYTVEDLGKCKLGNYFEPSFEIVFARGQPLDGQPIVETLSKIADTCEGFIEACEAHFLTSNATT